MAYVFMAWYVVKDKDNFALTWRFQNTWKSRQTKYGSADDVAL
jgi:hypothetical protein